MARVSRRQKVGSAPASPAVVEPIAEKPTKTARKTGQKAPEIAAGQAAQPEFTAPLAASADATGATAETAPGRSLRGHIDAAKGGRITGWVWDPQQPESRIALELVDGDTPLSNATAS